MATQSYQQHPSQYGQPQEQQQYYGSSFPQQSQQPTQQYQSQNPPRQIGPQPGQPTPPQHTRTRSRGFSFRSDKSDPKPNRLSLQESHAEKEAKRLHSKADPTLAMNEAEPSQVAAEKNGTLATPLRELQHKDLNGNLISDPDRSNPTRSKWERPLDTIRSFEAAIDGSYNRRTIYRSESESQMNWNNRRSSYYDNGPRFPQDSYYGSRPASTMYDPRQSMMNASQRGSYYDGHDGGRNRFSRMQTEPHMASRMNGHPRNVYPMPNTHQSHETVASGSGTGSYNEPAGYQTDPTSSENSSINRRSPPKRHDPMNDYGINFGGQQQSTVLQQPAMAANTQSRPSVPRKDVSRGGGSLLRKVSKAGPTTTAEQERPGMGEKRKSWFSRRFSKAS